MSNRYPGWDTADVLPGVKDPKPNKYGAQRTEYNGRMFASKWEAEYAEELDQRQRVGQVRNVRYQVRIPLFAATEPKIQKGEEVTFRRPVLYPSGRQAVHIVDFQFEEQIVKRTATGEPFSGGWRTRYVDTKGVDTAMGRFKRAIVEAMTGVRIELAKKEKRPWTRPT